MEAWEQASAELAEAKSANARPTAAATHFPSLPAPFSRVLAPPGVMAPPGKRNKDKRKAKTSKRLTASARVDLEITELEEIIEETKPKPGENPLAVTPRKSSDGANEMSLTGVRKFIHLPLSSSTKSALKECKFKEMTAIQRATLPHALCGRDVLGAAKTGSGKTLAYVIPLVELLCRHVVENARTYIL